MPPYEVLTADQWSIVRFAMPLSTSVIISEVCLSGGMQAFLHGGRSLTILENLWRGLYWILKTSISPKDQRELFVPFSKYVLFRSVCVASSQLHQESAQNSPKLLLIKFLPSIYTITAISWLPPWFHNFFYTGHFEQGHPLFLQPGCFWTSITTFCNLTCVFSGLDDSSWCLRIRSTECVAQFDGISQFFTTRNAQNWVFSPIHITMLSKDINFFSLRTLLNCYVTRFWWTVYCISWM